MFHLVLPPSDPFENSGALADKLKAIDSYISGLENRDDLRRFEKYRMKMYENVRNTNS